MRSATKREDTKMEFDAFMKAVDDAVIATAGTSVYDLADFNFYDLADFNFYSAFEAGESAKSVAKAVLAKIGFIV